MEYFTLSDIATALLYEKKAVQIKRFSVRDLSSVTDTYINCTATSPSHAASLADDLAERTALSGRKPLRTEGLRGGEWILVDYGDLIVNIFVRDARAFYDLDRLFPPDREEDVKKIFRAVDEQMSKK